MSGEEVPIEVLDEGMMEFKEDSVMQTMNLLNFSGLPETRVQDEEEEWNFAGQRISQMMTELELKMVQEKQEEIDRLQEELEREREEKVDMEGKIEGLVGFIAFAHGEMGKLIKYLLILAKTNLEVANVLNLGPFEDEAEMKKFLRLLKALGNQFTGQFERLGHTRDLLERVNRILEMAVDVSNDCVEEFEDDNEESRGDLEETEDMEATRESPVFEEESQAAYQLDSDQEPTFEEESQAAYQLDSPQEPPFEEESQAAYQLDSPQEPTSSSPPVEALQLRTPRRRTNFMQLLRIKTEPNLNLESTKKRHGEDHSKRHWGLFCLCGNRFSNRSRLHVHVKYFTTEWMFHCEICSKRFMYAGLLRYHLLHKHNVSDGGAGEIICTQCGEKVFSRKAFVEHLQVAHGGRKRISLESGHGRIELPPSSRGASTSRKNRQANNQSTQSFESEYEGPHGIDKRSTVARCLCGKVYSHKNALWGHVRSKQCGKVFQCYICPSRFDSHANLKLHVRNTHRREYEGGKYGCSMCGETFRKCKELKLHKMAKHRRQMGRKANKKKNQEHIYKRVYTNKRKPVPDSSRNQDEECVVNAEADAMTSTNEPPLLDPLPSETISPTDVEVAGSGMGVDQNVTKTDFHNDSDSDESIICLD